MGLEPWFLDEKIYVLQAQSIRQERYGPQAHHELSTKIEPAKIKPLNDNDF